MLELENYAMQSNFAGYANGIAGSSAYMSDELKAAPEVNAPGDVNAVFSRSCPEAAIRHRPDLDQVAAVGRPVQVPREGSGSAIVERRPRRAYWVTMLDFRVDGDRLWDSLMRMARIGATGKGGVNRQALTDPDREARDLFISWCRNAGCAVRVDPTGNIFARRAGRHRDRRAVLAGSHLDTQPAGGKFDGAYGVLAALEVVRTLNDAGHVTERPVEVVAWTNEEGCRFAPSMMGSGVFSGQFDPNRVSATTDAHGRSFGAELERIGYRGADRVSVDEMAAYFELHIEQGPVLEQAGKAIGVVTGAQGQRWFDLVVTGREAHAGTTPMKTRRDALLGAARIVEAVHRIGREHLPGACATVGQLGVHPELAQHHPRARRLQRRPSAPGGAEALVHENRPGTRGGRHLLSGGTAPGTGGDLAPVSAGLRRRLHRRGAPGGRRGRVRRHGDRLRRRARRLPHRATDAYGDDLHPVCGRHQP